MKSVVEVFEESGIEFDARSKSFTNNSVLFEAPLQTRSFCESFYSANFHQRELIVGQLAEKWMQDDGRVIMTDSLEDAQFIQWCCVSIGFGTTFAEGDFMSAENIPTRYYDIHLRDSEFGLTRWTQPGVKINVEEFVPEDGCMYCFTVPTSMFICRRNNKIFPTGNCGKDVSKVDRSAAYMARYIAKNAVLAGVSDRMLIQLSYAIGVAEPVSIFVDTYGTSKIKLSDGEIAEKIKKLFDLRPYAIEQRLKLREPIYLETAAYGHMGQEPKRVTKTFVSKYDEKIVKTVELFTWEKDDAVDEIKEAFGL